MSWKRENGTPVEKVRECIKSHCSRSQKPIHWVYGGRREARQEKDNQTGTEKSFGTAPIWRYPSRETAPTKVRMSGALWVFPGVLVGMERKRGKWPAGRGKLAINFRADKETSEITARQKEVN